MKGRKRIVTVIVVAAILFLAYLWYWESKEVSPPVTPEIPSQEIKAAGEMEQPEIDETEKAAVKKESAKKTVFEYEKHRELKSMEAELKLLGLSDRAFSELMQALELRIFGYSEDSLELLESLFATAEAADRPQLGMILIQGYLERGMVDRAEEIAGILSQEFPESAFPSIARAYIDIQHGRVDSAFQALEKVYNLGKNDRKTFLWWSILSGFFGRESQEKKIDGWLADMKASHPGNTALLLAIFKYQSQRRPDNAPATFREFEESCRDKELLVSMLGQFAWNCYSRGKVEEGRAALERAMKLDPENPDTLIARANYLKMTGSPSEAEQDLQKALDLTESPTMQAEIYRRLAETYRQQGKRDELFKAHEKSLSLDPDSPHNYISLVDSYFQMNEIDRAIESCNKGLALQDKVGMNFWNLSRLYNQLAILYNAKKDVDKCLENLEKAAEARISWSHDAYAQFFSQYRQYRSGSATIGKAKELVAKHPDNAWLQGNIGEFYGREGMYDDAIASFKKGMDLNQMDLARGYYGQRIVEMYLKKNDNEKAAEFARKMAEELPGNFLSYLGLGFVHREEEDYDRALEEYQTAYELANMPHFKTWALHSMAEIYEKLGDTGKAVESYEKIAEIQPSIWGVSALARNYEKLEMNEEAIEAYRKAIELSENPTDRVGYYGRISGILNKQGKDKEAIDTMKEYIADYPDYPGGHFHLGMAYRRTENYDRAEDEFRKSVELSGNNTKKKLMYLDRLVDMYTGEAKKYDRAKNVAEEMIELDPDYGKGYKRLADVYEAQEKYEDAAKTYERIAKRAGGLDNWRFARYSTDAALNYARGGWENRALTYMKGALTKGPNDHLLNEGMGDVYKECRQYHDALASYKKALDLAPEGRKQKIETKIEELKKAESAD